MQKIALVTALILLLSFANRSSAQLPAEERETFPDISGAEKIVWRCDEGTTLAVTYTKPNEWRRTVIVTDLRPYAMESRSNSKMYYFVLSSDGTKFLEISFEQFKADMEFLSPNYMKHLRGEPNDCVDGKSLRHGM